VEAVAEKKQQTFIVDLTEGIYVRTPIPSENHPALRSGFAGYPLNPRWNTAKYRAWKTGKHWRNLLAEEEMVIRVSDSMLVKRASMQEQEPVTPIQGNPKTVRMRDLQLA
jgi:hypothetical protein